MQLLKTLRERKAEGSVATVIGSLVVGIVMMFIGIYMIDAVSRAAAINNSSSFYSVYTNTVSITGTIFSVMGLVIIIIALAVAVKSLMDMGG